MENQVIMSTGDLRDHVWAVPEAEVCFSILTEILCVSKREAERGAGAGHVKVKHWFAVQAEGVGFCNH